MNAFLASAAECCWPAALAAGAGLAILPWLKRDNVAARAIVIAIVLALMWRYILWRWFSTLPPFGFTLDTLTALLFITVETATVVGATISFFFLTRVRDRAREVEANMGWLTSQPTPPLIDVLICTYNEEEAILEQTIVGAMAMDYPNYRLWTLDDGRRPWLEGAVRAARLRLCHARRRRRRQGRQHQQCAEAYRQAARRRRTSSRSSTPTSCRRRISSPAR